MRQTELQTYRERVVDGARGGACRKSASAPALTYPTTTAASKRSLPSTPRPACSRCTVVVPWSLCSMIDVGWSLVEARRVLRPRGHLRFVDHGLSPVGVRQHRMAPLGRRCAGGCHLNRTVDDLIRAAGFDLAELSTDYALGPRAMTYMYEGVATVR